MKLLFRRYWPCAIPMMALSASSAVAQEEGRIEEIVITGAARTYSALSTTQSMRDQQNPITSVLATIDNLPGVNVTEGDNFGFDDWSTTVNLRGYQTSLSDQQVGTTIDGFPNGDSNYGGGAKANRYIDSMNSGGVEVNQGIASIDTRTTESLGGTLNFTTDDPIESQRMRVQLSQGDFDSRRYYGRYDTGRILNDSTRAWFSFNHNEATDWMENSAQNERDHFAAKFISEFDNYTLTGYYAWDDIHEDNYQRLFSANEFATDPDWDRLIGEWTDIPYVNQVYRRGWSTNRENNFGYLKLDAEFTDELTAEFGVYHHEMDGRGDWIPPYIGNVTDDAGGPEYELQGNLPVLTSTNSFGRIYFTDPNGVSLTPDPNCQSSITFPYGGAGAAYDPACYPANSIPVQSFRHTHYSRLRDGITADFDFESSFGEVTNTVSGGFWYEDSERHEWRDWHKLEDARVGIDFNDIPYWIQYDRVFPRETTMWYLQDQIQIDALTFSFGIRDFSVDNKRLDLFDSVNNISFTSDSDVLLSGGATYTLPVDGLELFFGYSENVKPTLDLVLEREITDVIEPETAENMELGLRYVGQRLTASAVLFENEFNNRLEFFDPAAAASGIPNYTIGTTGRYDNVGGVDSSGFELAANININENWDVYASYTDTDATYIGTGLGAEADSALGIFPGRKVVNTPDSMWVLSLDWNRGNYFAGLSAKYVGDRYVDRANTWEAANYTATDLYLSVRGQEISDYLQGFDFGIVVNNLFDESYLGGISGGGAWIGAPRTAAFTATVDL
ncbi:MAG: TonB-dependent receptor [Proteobacteria bacterium]|nr:TonB-dependent receptor [Pseudomonadota bacterium]MDA0926993.1 TonB-dependent receptor [Pseudomonadota bacterium]